MIVIPVQTCSLLLYHASCVDNTDEVQDLLMHGADVNLQNEVSAISSTKSWKSVQLAWLVVLPYQRSCIPVSVTVLKKLLSTNKVIPRYCVHYSLHCYTATSPLIGLSLLLVMSICKNAV